MAFVIVIMLIITGGISKSAKQTLQVYNVTRSLIFSQILNTINDKPGREIVQRHSSNNESSSYKKESHDLYSAQDCFV